MSDRLKWALILGGCAVALGLFMQGPQWLHSANPLYRGIPVTLNSDEPVYLARVQESLSGRPEQAAEAFTGHPGLVGSQVAFIERWYGTLFRWTGWNAATVLQFLDSLIPALVFLVMFAFFRGAGLPNWYALGATVLFCLVELYSLNRPIHMRSSFLIMLGSLIGITYAAKLKYWGVALGGILLGLLVGIYFWSFTFAWAFWGVFALWEISEWVYHKWLEHQKFAHSRIRRLMHTSIGIFWHFRPRKPTFRFNTWHMLLITGVVGLVCALPFIAHFVNMSFHPLYDYASFRSGMHPGRLPESWPYSILFTGMCVSILYTMYREYPLLLRYRVLCVMVFATWVYMHQNVVHGITFNFVSHGIFSMATASVGLIALCILLRSRTLAIGAVCAAVYLLAIGYDGRYVLKQWKVSDDRFADQHLVEMLPALDALPRSRILSDPYTSGLIAGHTHHDVVFSIYLKNVLMSHGELASRYCLTQIPVAPQERNIAGKSHLIFPDASAAYGQEVRAEEVRLVENACREMDLDPALSLETYEVDYVLWNRIRAPEWDIKRIPVLVNTVESGDEWVLLSL